MQTVHTVLLVLQVLVALGLIGFILVQHGKGADAGAAFGSGASATVFGARGSGNFLTRTTTVLAFIFLVNSLALAWIARERIRNQQSLMDQEGAAAISAPADSSVPVGDSPAEPVAGAAVQAPADDVPVSDVPTGEVPAGDVPATPEPASDVPVAPQSQ